MYWVVGLFELGLSLRNGKIVRNTSVKALLRLRQSFHCQIDIGARGLHQLGRSLDIQDRRANIGIDLLNFVRKPRLVLIENRLRYLLLAAVSGDLQDG